MLVAGIVLFVGGDGQRDRAVDRRLAADLGNEQADRFGDAQARERDHDLHGAVAPALPAVERGAAAFAWRVRRQGGEKARQLVVGQAAAGIIPGDVGAVDAEDGQLRRIWRQFQVLVAALEQAQVTVGDLAVEDALALDAAVDEAEQVGLGRLRKEDAFLLQPSCQVVEHEDIDLRRFLGQGADGTVGAQAPAGLGECRGGDECLECLDGVGIPRGQVVHGGLTG